MSQQINLLLPELRPRRDWLAFPVVASLVAASLAVVAAGAAWGRYEVRALASAQARTDGELRDVQQQIQALGQAVAGKKADPALQAEIDRLKTTLQQQEAVLAVVAAGRPGDAGGHAALLRGFARQAMDGVWLTGFSFSGDGAEIRGRLSDPALLPRYIRRLNGEGAFQGRRFAALDMKSGEAAGAPGAKKGPGYTEFVLLGTRREGEGAKP